MQYVDVKIHDGVATIMMQRPDVRNALNPQLIEDLRTAFSDVHQEKKVMSVLLTGQGDEFCSGMDLSVMKEIADMPEHEALPEWFTLWRNLTELLEELLRFPRPVVAAIDGAAVGAGLAIALACDILVLSERASLSAVAVRRGLVGGATTALLNFRYGAALAARMAIAGHQIDAHEAYRLGMCYSKPVVPEQIWVAAKAVGEECGKSAGEALQANKKLLNESIGESLIGQLAAGAADSATACTTESASEGIRSFLEHRLPEWP